MKERIRNLRKDRIIYRLFLLSLIAMFLTLLLIILSYRNLPPLIPLFNQLPWGEKRISESWGIFIPLLTVFFIWIFNIILSSITYEKTPLISRMFAVTTFGVSILTFIFVVRTIDLIS